MTLTFQQFQRLLAAVRATTFPSPTSALLTADKDELEVVSGKLQPKSEFATMPLRIGTAGQSFAAAGGTLGSGATQFNSAGSNLSYSGGAWANNLVQAANEFNSSTKKTTSNNSSDGGYAVSASNEGNSPAWQAFDSDNSGTSWYTTSTGAPWWIAVDFGSNKKIGFVKWKQLIAAQATHVKFETSTDGSNWTLRGEITGMSDTLNAYTSLKAVATPTSARHFRVYFPDFEGWNNINIADLLLYEAEIATTDNKLTSNDLIPSGSASIAPATLYVAADSIGTEADPSTYNVEYSTDGTNWSSVYTGTQFIADAGGTIAAALSGISLLKLRIQPIGTQPIYSVTIDANSSEVKIDPSGKISGIVNGVTVWESDASGTMALTDLTAVTATITEGTIGKESTVSGYIQSSNDAETVAYTSPSLPDNSATQVTARVVGITTDGTGRVSYCRSATVFRATGTASITTISNVSEGESGDSMNTNMTLGVTSNSFTIKVLGVDTKTTKWYYTVTTQTITTTATA